MRKKSIERIGRIDEFTEMENNNKITSRGLDALLYIAGFRLFGGGRGQDSPIIVIHNTGISSIIVRR